MPSAYQRVRYKNTNFKKNHIRSIMDTTLKLNTLAINDAKTYLVVSLFVLGNIALPQIFHLIPQGGLTWLPSYFFTLVGAY